MSPLVLKPRPIPKVGMLYQLTFAGSIARRFKEDTHVDAWPAVCTPHGAVVLFLEKLTNNSRGDELTLYKFLYEGEIIYIPAYLLKGHFIPCPKNR